MHQLAAYGWPQGNLLGAAFLHWQCGIPGQEEFELDLPEAESSTFHTIYRVVIGQVPNQVLTFSNIKVGLP
jgi:hypothetical protein